MLITKFRGLLLKRALSIFRYSTIQHKRALSSLVITLSWLFKYNYVVTISVICLLSYDVSSGSEITPCNKICKPLVVYRFSGNVMTSITTLCT